MNVLHINTYDKGGGAEQFAFDFVHHHFEGEDIKAKLLVKRKKTTSEKVSILKRPFVSHFTEKIDKGLYKVVKHTLFSDLSVLNKLHFTSDNLQKNDLYSQADIIHLHNIHYDFFDFQTLAEIAQQKPIVWTLHDMWAITGGEAYTFENENFKKGIGKTPYKSFHPLLNPIIDRRQQYLEQKKKIYEQINRLEGKKKHGFVFVPVSKWLQNSLEESYVLSNVSFNTKNISINTIQNGIDMSIFKNLEQRDWKHKKILFFNTDNPYKGASIFEKIIPDLKNERAEVELFVVGKNLSASVLQQLSGNTNIKTHHLKPVYDRHKMNSLYNSVDILVFSSKAENFSLLVLEAMAAGVFIIGSDAGGIKEQLDDDRGLLFENGSSDDLLAKLKSVLANPSDELRAKGKRASHFVRDNWSVEKMRKKYLDLYKTLL